MVEDPKKEVSISLDKSKATIYAKGEKTVKLTVKVKGTSAKVKWKSSDPSVAVVNSKGKVTAKKAGVTVITASVNGVKAKCKVKVKEKKETDRKFSGKGSGTEIDPYRITNARQMNEVRYNLSAYYVLEEDIDLSKFSDWIPIGSDADPFVGQLDGRGHVIRNVNININGVFNDRNIYQKSIGLFSYIKDSIICNIGVENASYNISYNSYRYSAKEFIQVGGITGLMVSSVIEQSYFRGAIKNECDNMIFARAGGISAITTNSSQIRNCYSDTDIIVEGNTNNTMAAGITAWLDNSSVDKCYVLGNITGYSTYSYGYTGGINASCINASTSLVSNCVSMLSSINSSTYKDEIGNFVTKSDNRVIAPDSSDAFKQETYTAYGWDFDNVWVMNGKYPLLKCGN